MQPESRSTQGRLSGQIRGSFRVTLMTPGPFEEAVRQVTMNAMIVDTPYEFPGFHPQPALCRLRIFAAGLDRPPIIIATDSPLYRGTSITRHVENLASIDCRDFQIAPDAMIWIEHYCKWRSYDVTFRFVEFQVKPKNGEPCKPTWHYTDRVTVERLIGGPLAD